MKTAPNIIERVGLFIIAIIFAFLIWLYMFWELLGYISPWLFVAVPVIGVIGLAVLLWLDK